jgi:hypothetical protein
LAIITLVSLMLAVLNYQTNQFAIAWCIYPIVICYGVYLINRYVR